MADIPILIERLTQVATSGTYSGADRIEKLMLVLDEIMVAAQQVNFIFDDSEYVDPPSVNQSELRERVAPLFPKLGLYNCALSVSTDVGKSGLGTGDVIDDLVEIIADLAEVAWRFENNSVEDALFDFQFGYRSHWGKHARNVQLCLHDHYW